MSSSELTTSTSSLPLQKKGGKSEIGISSAMRKVRDGVGNLTDKSRHRVNGCVYSGITELDSSRESTASTSDSHLHTPEDVNIKISPKVYCLPENILMWKNVSKRTNQKTTSLQLLQNVSGRVKAGEIVAVMGHSGCGKVISLAHQAFKNNYYCVFQSTLMNLLSGHYCKGMEGVIEINGKVIDPSSRRKIAYVTQTDIFFEDLTVREQVDYAARLCLSGTYSSEAISALAKQTLEELHIEYCADVQIKFLSGGQRKRCSICSYLASMPQFLILDGQLLVP
jgi:ABC-type nitrate/sulfonate/bicarbonate transport system ATPase subunit